MTTTVSNEALIKKAKELYGYFEYRKRDNGEEFVTLKDDAPENLRDDLIYPAHGNGEMFTDDFIYETIWDSISLIADMMLDTDIDELCYEIKPDIYNHDLLKWVASNLGRMSYADDVIEQGLGLTTLSDILSMAQANEKRQIFQSVLSSITEMVEVEEDE